MFEELLRFNLNYIVDVSIIDKGVALISTAEGDLTIKNIPKCIKEVVHIIDKKGAYIYVETIHYNSNERFIDIISLEGRK